MTDDDVERLSLQAGWGGNRQYMTPADYRIWCDRMRKFAELYADKKVPLTNAPNGWCQYIAGMLECYLKSNPPVEGREAAMVGIIERRLHWFATFTATVASGPVASPSDPAFKIVSAWLQQEGKAANGDQLYTMCRFADFVLSHAAPHTPQGGDTL